MTKDAETEKLGETPLKFGERIASKYGVATNMLREDAARSLAGGLQGEVPTDKVEPYLPTDQYEALNHTMEELEKKFAGAPQPEPLQEFDVDYVIDYDFSKKMLQTYGVFQSRAKAIEKLPSDLAIRAYAILRKEHRDFESLAAIFDAQGERLKSGSGNEVKFASAARELTDFINNFLAQYARER